MPKGGPRKGAGAKPQSGAARLHKIDIRVNEDDLVEIDLARGPVKRGAFVRDAALQTARAGIRSAKEGEK